MEKFLDVAKRAASRAGEFLLSDLDSTREIRYKGEGYRNPVSAVDEKAEDIIVSIIQGAFPEHSFISEEMGSKDTPSDYTWVIDPLDGTINFLHRCRHFGVSIALLHRKEVILGVVYDPVLGEMFTAVRGGGAYLNERRVQVSKIVHLEASLLAMGFPYNRSSAAFSRSVEYFVRLLRDSQAIRRHGSTALALCQVACGRYDGFCVAGNELWDYAAGTLMVSEAGGKVTDFKGNLFRISSRKNEVLATNGKIHQAILQCVMNQP